MTTKVGNQETMKNQEGRKGPAKMAKEIEIAVENRLITEKRDINVFHHSTRSAHIISHSSSITLPLETVKKGDYLQISAARGPGNLWKHYLISLPSWADFEFYSKGNVTLTHSHDSKRTLIKIPPGPPTWELVMKMPIGLSYLGSLTENYVTICDE